MTIKNGYVETQDGQVYSSRRKSPYENMGSRGRV
jgi:hypothetical protein